jgi:hypothetical protein
MKINTTKTVATTLGISVQRVRQIVKELNITPIMIGKAIVLSDTDVKRLEKRKTSRGPTKKHFQS